MRLLLTAAFGLLIVAPAFAADGPTCVRRNDIRDYSSPQRKVLILENYAHHKVRLTLTGTCAGFGVYDSFQIIGPLEPAASCVVVGDSVHTNWAGEPGVCQIVTLEPYDGPTHPSNARQTSD